jgi:hypothetical protein
VVVVGGVLALMRGIFVVCLLREEVVLFRDVEDLFDLERALS